MQTITKYILIFIVFFYFFTSKSKKNVKIIKKGLKFLDKKTKLKNYNEIINNLWLGDMISSTDKVFLKNNNIKLVINVTKDLPFTDIDYIDKIRIPVDDNFTLKTGIIIKKSLPYIIDNIDKVLNNNQGVLIHCKMGSQRSATLLAMYLLKRFDISKEEIYKLLRHKRRIAFFPVSNYDKVFIDN